MTRLALLLAASMLGLSAGAGMGLWLVRPLAAGARRGVGLRALVDGLTLGVVPLVVLARLLPHVAERLGVAALALCAVGFAGLALVDRLSHRYAHRIGPAVVYPTLLLHSLTDGTTLAAAAAATGSWAALLLAVVTHRLPEGLFVVASFRARGRVAIALRLVGLAAATLLGAALSRTVLAGVPPLVADAVVAVGLGAMLQLSLHRHGPPATAAGERWLAALGAVAGVALVLAFPGDDDVLAGAGGTSLAATLLPLAEAVAPALLMQLALVVGLGAAARRRPGLRALAAPLAGVVAALPLSLRWLGGDATAARFAVMGVSVLASMLLAWSARRAPTAAPAAADGAAPPLVIAVRTLFPRATLGVLGAAALATLLPPAALVAWSAPATLALALATGALAAAEPVPATAVAAVLLAKGLPPAHALAFFAALPLSPRFLAEVRARWGSRAAWTAALATLALALAVVWLMAPAAALWPAPLLPRAGAPWMGPAAAAVAALAAALSLGLLGPRVFAAAAFGLTVSHPGPAGDGDDDDAHEAH